jgi:UDP-4-amino-4,6-dideoxy-N-acetyl-beta-L-altrosamine N-acetyltransferase
MSGFLRKLQHDDLSLIRQWRNHPEINKFMFSQHEITQQEHQAWFESSQQNALRHLFVFEEQDERKGFLQLQQKSAESNVFEWGFYICPDAVRGTGSRMAKLAIDLAFLELNAIKLYGEALGFNQPSIRLHQKLGFVEEGLLRKQHFLNNQYHDVHCFGMLKAEWQPSAQQSKVGKS